MTSLAGKFITFEGADGSGKTTQAARLAAHLQAQGAQVTLVREPGGTQVGEAVRHILFHTTPLCRETELLLFWASRLQLLQEVIIPRLREGHVVISDRFTDSTLAYQGIARGLGTTLCQSVESFYRATFQLPYPDATLLFLAPTNVLQARLQNRGESNNLDALLGQANDFYHQLAGTAPRYRVIDAAATPEVVFAEVLRTLTNNLTP